MSIPENIRRLAARHVASIASHNAVISRARETDAMFGGGGRYEWEVRAKQPDITPSVTRLDEIEARARELGEEIAQLYGAEGRPMPLPWSAAALTWQQEADARAYFFDEDEANWRRHHPANQGA